MGNAAHKRAEATAFIFRNSGCFVRTAVYRVRKRLSRLGGFELLGSKILNLFFRKVVWSFELYFFIADLDGVAGNSHLPDFLTRDYCNFRWRSTVYATDN